MLSRQPYQGLARKLILAFDVGTTFSGVSYCILDPGDVPEIHGVARYPAQEQVGGDNKIPSILYYDHMGTVRAIGAEALQPHILEQAEDENWTKLEWWKLHLRAKHLPSSHIKDDDIPPLPRNIDAVRVLSDFIKYLFDCSRTYIMESHPSGSELWQSLGSRIEFVLTHPNGWEGPQQQQIRRAAQLAGLIPSGEEGQSRLHLLTEGEASLHFCVTNVLTSDSLSTTPVVCLDEFEEQDIEQECQGVIIIDAGGGTIDLSAYSVKLSEPVSVEELAPAECRLEGSVFITVRARQFLESELANSRYGTPEMVQQMSKAFDKTTKLTFRNPEDPQYVQFGSVRDKDPDYNIRSGRLKMAGKEVAKFFEPSIEGIAEAFKQQTRAAAIPIKHAFLVGGFAASDFLFTGLRQHPVFTDVTLCRPGHHVNKAVADGAVSFLIDRLVTTRVAKFTYGIPCGVQYNPFLVEHQSRKDTMYRTADGQSRIPNAFSTILKKGTQVSEQQEFAQPYYVVTKSAFELTSIAVDIYAYRGSLLDPTWMDEEPDSLTRMCTVCADTDKLAKALRPQRTAERTTYYKLNHSVVLLFGLTELKAQISWVEDGIEKRSPASIVYDD